MNYFDTEKDKQFPCFCQACAVGYPKEEQSADPRYCKGCYEVLLREAEMLVGNKRPAWIPKPQNAKIDTEKQYHIENHIDKEKTKMSTLISPSLTVDNFRPRGRPKTYKKHSLPDDKIKQMHKEGMGAKAIATQLKREEGIVVSYKTVQRVLSGQRN